MKRANHARNLDVKIIIFLEVLARLSFICVGARLYQLFHIFFVSASLGSLARFVLGLGGPHDLERWDGACFFAKYILANFT